MAKQAANLFNCANISYKNQLIHNSCIVLLLFVIILMQQSQLNTEFLVHFSKLNELLRFYSMGKKLQKFNLIKEKTKLKIEHIQKLMESYPQYYQIQLTISNKIASTFQELPPPPAKSVVQPAIKSSVQAPSETSKKSVSINGSGNANVSGNQSMNNSNISKFQAEKSFISKQSSPKKTVPIPIAVGSQKSKSIIIEKPKPALSQMPKESTPSNYSESTPQRKIIQQPIKQPEVVPETIEKKKLVHSNSASILMLTPQLYVKTGQKILNEFSSLNSGSSNPINKDELKKLEQMQAMQVESISSIYNDNEQKAKSRSSSIMFMLEQQHIDKPLFEKKSSDSFNRDQDNSYELQQRGSEGSVYDDVIDLVLKFLSENKERLSQVLIFNNELFDHMQNQLDGLVYLFGINKPQTKKINQLYVCTIMKYSIAEILRSQEKYQKEMKDFSNNIRIPLGLIRLGQGVSSITPQEIKFLINLQSPYPVILLLKDNTANQGVLCQFQSTVIERIRITPRKQLAQCADQLKKKTFTLPYNEANFPKEKNKVTTKFLPRVIPNLAEEAPNAIAISGNQCIRQEKHSFIYKLHTKFLVTSKADFNIYYVNNNLVNARMSFKDKQFQVFRKQVLEGQSKIPSILSINVGKEAIPIKKQFFQVLVESKDKRDTFFFINFNSLTVKKTVIAALRAQVTMQMVKSFEAFDFKSFEKDTQLTVCLHVINKTNIKQFQQNDGKSDLIEIKPR